jgi:hypothetical protein
MPPETGAALPVRDGNDEDVIGFDGVEHGVWKDTDARQKKLATAMGLNLVTI